MLVSLPLAATWRFRPERSNFTFEVLVMLDGCYPPTLWISQQSVRIALWRPVTSMIFYPSDASVNDFSVVHIYLQISMPALFWMLIRMLNFRHQLILPKDLNDVRLRLAINQVLNRSCHPQQRVIRHFGHQPSVPAVRKRFVQREYNVCTPRLNQELEEIPVVRD